MTIGRYTRRWVLCDPSRSGFYIPDKATTTWYRRCSADCSSYGMLLCKKTIPSLASRYIVTRMSRREWEKLSVACDLQIALYTPLFPFQGFTRTFSTERTERLTTRFIHRKMYVTISVSRHFLVEELACRLWSAVVKGAHDDIINGVHIVSSETRLSVEKSSMASAAPITMCGCNRLLGSKWEMRICWKKPQRDLKRVVAPVFIVLVLYHIK